MKEIRIVIITGLSGSGKSTALRTLEDLGFFCVDNLPIILLPKFIELCERSTDDITKIALVMDIRERKFLEEYPEILEEVRNEGYRVDLIFLDSSDDALIQRFSETRRQHPLSEGGSVVDGIKIEREKLRELKSRSDKIFDTTALTVHQLRNLFQEYFEQYSRHTMSISIISFGFKYGVPHDTDLLFDVRFLPNPYFVPDLKDLNGNDEKVAKYVFLSQETKAFFEKLKDFLAFQVPLFEREGKAYLTIAIGCTGGRHRSVLVANRLKDFFSKGKHQVYMNHRDLNK
jgi:UPF0042 nucleotide-binding protein